MKIFNTISLEPLEKVKKNLDIAIDIAKSELEIAGSIQLFEICYELSWKTMKKTLKELGLPEANSPRSVFKAAYSTNLINNLGIWIESINKRNLTVHTYNENLLEEVFIFLPIFNQEIGLLLENIKKLNK